MTTRSKDQSNGTRTVFGQGMMMTERMTGYGRRVKVKVKNRIQ